MNTVLDLRLNPADSSVRIVFHAGSSIVDQLHADSSPIEATDVWLDFAAIETVNSNELSALVRFALRLRRREKEVSLCNVGAHLAEIFQLTRFGDWTVS